MASLTACAPTGGRALTSMPCHRLVVRLGADGELVRPAARTYRRASVGMADEADLEFAGLNGRVGSNPTSPTSNYWAPARSLFRGSNRKLPRVPALTSLAFEPFYPHICLNLTQLHCGMRRCY